MQWWHNHPENMLRRHCWTTMPVLDGWLQIISYMRKTTKIFKPQFVEFSVICDPTCSTDKHYARHTHRFLSTSKKKKKSATEMHPTPGGGSCSLTHAQKALPFSIISFVWEWGILINMFPKQTITSSEMENGNSFNKYSEHLLSTRHCFRRWRHSRPRQRSCLTELIVEEGE